MSPQIFINLHPNMQSICGHRYLKHICNNKDFENVIAIGIQTLMCTNTLFVYLPQIIVNKCKISWQKCQTEFHTNGYFKKDLLPVRLVFAKHALRHKTNDQSADYRLHGFLSHDRCLITSGTRTDPERNIQMPVLMYACVCVCNNCEDRVLHEV